MEEQCTKIKIFKYNLYICSAMLIICAVFGVLMSIKTYTCPKGSYMLRNEQLCAENPYIFESTINDHNKYLYKIMFFASLVIFSISTIIYFVLFKKIENDGQLKELHVILS